MSRFTGCDTELCPRVHILGSFPHSLVLGCSLCWLVTLPNHPSGPSFPAADPNVVGSAVTFRSPFLRGEVRVAVKLLIIVSKVLIFYSVLKDLVRKTMSN